jgi:hypothetical protein
MRAPGRLFEFDNDREFLANRDPCGGLDQGFRGWHRPQSQARTSDNRHPARALESLLNGACQWRFLSPTFYLEGLWKLSTFLEDGYPWGGRYTTYIPNIHSKAQELLVPAFPTVTQNEKPTQTCQT